MKIIIVVPTYNEAENVGRLIPAVFDAVKNNSNHEFHILVVDGNSPDGTGDVVRNLGSKYPNLHLLLEEKKAGIGAAYFYAFKHAMKEMNADVLIEMDADFQHDPKDVLRLVAEIDNGYDYVIGSRFTKGGSIPEEWAFIRKFLSWGGSFFSKIVLGIFTINDFTTGFKASRVRGFVDKLNFDEVLSKSFAYKIDLLYKMHKLGAKIKEIPIAFGMRDRGDSKIERLTMLDSFLVVVKIRLRESRSFFKFLAVGFLGLFTDLGFFNIFRLTILSSNYASAASGLIAMVVTYTFNNLWSFSDRKITSLKKTIVSMLVYFAFSYVPIIFRSWLVGFSVRTFGDNFWVANIAFFIGIVLGLIWNFTVYSKIIWRRKSL